MSTKTKLNFKEVTPALERVAKRFAKKQIEAYLSTESTPQSEKRAEKLIKKDWVDEKNTEVRRVIQDRMGERFVLEIGGKLIGKDASGELWEIELPHDVERVARYIHVPDASTDREYWLRVPPDTPSPIHGKLWTFDTDFKETDKLLKEQKAFKYFQVET